MGGLGKFVAANIPKTDYTRNSAEWGLSREGVELHFTHRDPDSGYVAAVASQLLNPHPRVTELTRNGGQGHITGTPFPSKDIDDPNARIVYYEVQDARINLAWKDVLVPREGEDDPADVPSHPIPDVQAVVYKGPRWSPGERALLLTRPVGDERHPDTQLFHYDIDSGAFTQLTFEERPVLDGQIIELRSGARFLLGTFDQDGVIVYRERSDGAFAFEKLLFMPDRPSDDHSVTLWEPFEFKGELYVVAQVAGEEGPYSPSTLRVAAGEDGNPFDRTVCGKANDRIRFDPEAFTGPDDAWVYFYDPDDHSFYTCETGLGAWTRGELP